MNLLLEILGGWALLLAFILFVGWRLSGWLLSMERRSGNGEDA